METLSGGPDIPFQAVLGLVLILLLAWLTGKGKSRNWQALAVGLGLQFLLALLFLRVAFFQQGLAWLNRGILAVIRASEYATSYVLGHVGGGEPPFEVVNESATGSLAFISLPVVLLLSVLSALLWHWRVIPFLVTALSHLLRRSFGLSGSVGFGCAANIFFGMVEAPLLIRGYLLRMNHGGLFILMTCGMATVAGTVMGLYASILLPVMDNAIAHILTASVISAPAAILLALLIMPAGTDQPPEEDNDLAESERYANSMDAIVQGTTQGIRLLVSIVAMLIVFVGLAALVNEFLSLLPPVNGEPVTLALIFGTAFAPLMWLIGIPWQEAHTAGQLMGTKTVLNEFIAFLDLAALDQAEFSGYSRVVMTYALCGFANLGSLGIMLAGLSSMCPQRTGEFVRLAPLSLWSGTLSTCMTAAVVSLIL